ncbi:siderophore-interacting protein [Chitinophaga filiformis]|uniref:NADPH-dependent ferric siderophore reductase, contains FAD-binding and SIP domains n=1 Tax=Chitinophaga filiformis TaxID=104663 RepID=A0A1G7X732_CHIFI|nr:siderophore-interacting protein [Chitinophaga filiformis]SDG79933.1 NADPH-dependent ferric siderophore reductase, contains FAD-binding and SIP domains [Chitinophaga filiformis]
MSYLKEKATAFLMSRIGKPAHVIAAEYITDSLLAITLHMPEFVKWRSCQHLKFETEKSHFRDYTLAQWAESSKQGTLLIDVGHKGPGSNWARQLQPGQSLVYAGPGGGFHQPTNAPHLVCIGDASAIGQFTSLYHRTESSQQLHALICHQQALPATILEMPVITTYGHVAGIERWLLQQPLPMHDTTFYTAGNIPLVVQIKKLLKRLGAQQVKAQGFWE